MACRQHAVTDAERAHTPCQLHRMQPRAAVMQEKSGDITDKVDNMLSKVKQSLRFHRHADGPKVHLKVSKFLSRCCTMSGPTSPHPLWDVKPRSRR